MNIVVYILVIVGFDVLMWLLFMWFVNLCCLMCMFGVDDFVYKGLECVIYG